MQPYPPMGQVPGQMPGQMPGQPGHLYAYQPPPPSSPRTLGTLSIVFGAVVAAMAFFGMITSGSGMMAAFMNKMPAGGAAMSDYPHAIRTPTLIQNGMLVVMSVWLIFIGFGQRGYRASAARQSVAWGVIALFVVAIMAVTAFTVLGPAMSRMMEELQRIQPGPNPMRGIDGVMGFAAALGVAFYAPYPIILLVTFRKPAVVAAMTA
jgi:hypothetical protein